MLGEGQLLTGASDGVNEIADPNTELCNDDYIQDSRDPSVLPRYRVSPTMVGMSESLHMDEGRRTFGPGQFERRWK